MRFFYLLGIVIALIINIVTAIKFAAIAEMKGHEGNTYFWFTFLLGMVGMLMVIALPTLLEKDEPKPSLEKDDPKPSIIMPRTTVQADEWKCTCGRIHKQYVSTCSCGASKNEAIAAQNNKKD